MTEQQKENLIKAINHRHFHNDVECEVKDVNFQGGKVCIDYSEKGNNRSETIYTICFG